MSLLACTSYLFAFIYVSDCAFLDLFTKSHSVVSNPNVFATVRLCVKCWHVRSVRKHNLQCTWSQTTLFSFFFSGVKYFTTKMQTPNGIMFWWHAHHFQLVVAVVVAAAGYSSRCHAAGTSRLFTEWQEGQRCPFFPARRENETESGLVCRGCFAGLQLSRHEEDYQSHQKSKLPLFSRWEPRSCLLSL